MLELACRALGTGGREPLDSRAAADTYHGADWVPEYFKEFDAAYVSEWSPYVYWKRAPYAGKYINVDERGVRATAGGAPPETPDALRIWMFGGSTLWGTGARDEHTIPSILSRLLTDAGTPANATNFGESGYVSTQEMLRLMLELRKQAPPDIVIFYDGCNDIYAALQNGVAGIPQNESNRVREFNAFKEERRAEVLPVLLLDLVNNSALRETFNRVPGRRARKARTSKSGAERVETLTAADSLLARDALEVYRENVRVVTALGDEYGFRPLFFWQPLLFGKGDITEYESELLARRDGRTRALVEAAYAAIAEGEVVPATADFYDLQDLFQSDREPRYIDPLHLGESGNRIVAERMAAIVTGFTVER